MRPFTLLIKPTGPDCNIACRYCFYSPKVRMFGSGAHRMSEQVLEKLVSSYLRLNLPAPSFAWQGGEPTLMGLDFYKKTVTFQQKHGEPGQAVSNALQTNGILLDDDWCGFLAEYKFLVGISLDGPKEYHDYYRLDRAGKGTFDKVMTAVEKCRQHNVEFNILVLLNNKNVTAPDELFDFFTGLNIRFLQFVPCVEQDPATGKIADFSITARQYGDFMCRIFDRWIEYGPTKLSVRLFDSVIAYCVTGEHTVCTFRPQCSDYIVIEHNGDAFCCDFFVEDIWRLGNIFETPIEKLAAHRTKRKFSRQKRLIKDKCLLCKYLDICRGGCLKDRFVLGPNADETNYFCRSYKQFYDYTLNKFWEIAANLPNIKSE